MNIQPELTVRIITEIVSHKYDICIQICLDDEDKYDFVITRGESSNYRVLVSSDPHWDTKESIIKYIDELLFGMFLNESVLKKEDESLINKIVDALEKESFAKTWQMQ